MISPAPLPMLPLMPRGVRARPTRFAPAPVFRERAPAVALQTGGPTGTEALRKNPAWIDRDL
jgi:hypothetical protein